MIKGIQDHDNMAGMPFFNAGLMASGTGGYFVSTIFIDQFEELFVPKRWNVY